MIVVAKKVGYVRLLAGSFRNIWRQTLCNHPQKISWPLFNSSTKTVSEARCGIKGRGVPRISRIYLRIESHLKSPAFNKKLYGRRDGERTLRSRWTAYGWCVPPPHRRIKRLRDEGWGYRTDSNGRKPQIRYETWRERFTTSRIKLDGVGDTMGEKPQSCGSSSPSLKWTIWF